MATAAEKERLLLLPQQLLTIISRKRLKSGDPPAKTSVKMFKIGLIERKCEGKRLRDKVRDDEIDCEIKGEIELKMGF